MIGDLLGGFGSIFGASSARRAAKADRELQKEFAQNAVQWKVADGRAAGLHPLAAIGASTTGYTPVGDNGAGQMMADGMAGIGAAVSKAKNKGREDELHDLSVAQIKSQIGVNEAMAQSYLAEARRAAQGNTGFTSGINETLESTPSRSTVGDDGTGLPLRAPYAEDTGNIEERYGDESFLNRWSAWKNYYTDWQWAYRVKPLLLERMGREWILETTKRDPKELMRKYRELTKEDPPPSTTEPPKTRNPNPRRRGT